MVGPEWIAYFSTRDDQLHLITVDLSWRVRAPIAELPFVLRMRMQAPPLDAHAPPGSKAWYFSDAQHERCDRVKEGLCALAAAPTRLRWLIGARPTRIVHVADDYRPGEVTLYFYSERAIEKRWLVALAERVPGVEWTVRHGMDRGWAVYRDELHPGPALHPLLCSWAQLDQREQGGDRLAVPRPVDHTLYFSDAKARAAFIARTATPDWTTSTFDLDGGARRFGLNIKATHSLVRPKSDSMILGFASHAAPLDGVYDGWGAFIVSSEASR